MKVSFLKSLLAVATIAAAGAVNASQVGYTDWSAIPGLNPSWSLWDVFPAGEPNAFGGISALSFSGRAGDLGTSGAILSASFSPGIPPAMVLEDGPGTPNSQLYTGGGSNSFSISAITEGTLSTLVLQIKQNGQNRQNPANPPDTSGLTNYFSPTLNGTLSSQSSVGSLIADPDNNWIITTWIWEGLDIGAGEAINLSFSGAANGHKAFDGFRIDADAQLAIPEPSTYALIGLGLGAVLWSFRRRSARISA